MNKYIVTYELNNKSKDYSGLFNAIKVHAYWWHYIESVWIVKSHSTAQEISSGLLNHIDADKDYLLVIKVDSAEKEGWLPQKAWDWLNS